MSWIATKAALKATWVWLKTYWQVPFMVVWTIAVYVLSRRNTDALLEVLQAKRKSYDEQIEIIRQHHNEELVERDKIIEQYKRTIVLIEEKYKKEEKVLKTKEKKKIKEIVEKSKGEPDVIKAEIEKSFGFVYVD